LRTRPPASYNGGVEGDERPLEDVLPAVVDVLPAIVVIVDRDGRIAYMSPFMEELSGRRLADNLGKDWFSTFLPECDRDSIRSLFAKAQDGGDISGHVHAIVTANGEAREIEWYCRPVRGWTGLVCVGKDVTDARRAARDRAQAERRLRTILDGMFAFVGLFDLDGKLLEANEPPLARARLSRRDTIGKPFADAYWWSHSAEMQARVRAALTRAAAGEIVRGDFTVRLADDEIITLDTMFGPLRGDDGRIDSVIGSGVDVTEQRRTEEELRTHSLVLMSMSEGVLFIDRDEIIRFTNPALDAMFGYAEGELVGQHVGILNGASEEANRASSARVRAAVEESGAWQGEFQNRRKDGATFFTRARITQIERPGEVMFVSVQRDITEEKRAEEALRASLREKETLLREVHHRVKNNLQVISSLLHFQAKRVRDPADLAAFEDGRNRLLAMILVHEKLYQAGQLSRIELAGYLRSLVGALADSFERDHPIAIEVCVDPIELPIELALPTGMLVCELVTNIFKYAFPADTAGNAAVKVTRSADDIVIDVSDRGAGFPNGFDAATASSFGWRLVRTLALQLDGRVDAATNGGARITVTFPAPAGEAS
jgi:PAS domain S-box-containing protein